MSIVIEKANLRFSRSQFDIMENYKPFITKGFGVYSEKNSNSGHFQLFYFSKTLMHASVDNHLSYCWLLLSWKRYVYLYIS
jgi:hypothetical protein